MTKPLAQTLEDLKNVSADFNTVVENLFEFRFEDYNQVFKINELDVPAKTYKRFPVFNNGNAVAILMLWGAENKTAIHDHKNYEGKIKVAIEGISFAEEMGGIHSIVNNKPTLSVSLHIYKTNQLNLSGVRIFDLENKKWAVLNDKAPSCTWNLPEEAFEKIYQL